MTIRRLLASSLAVVAALLLAGVRHLERTDPGPAQAQGPAAPRRVPGEPDPSSRAAAPSAGSLAPLGDPRLEEQVARVVASFDRTGRPPAGIAQGGRRGGPRGQFENAEGRLPRRPPGYYSETDVWPRGPDGRGAERLVLGREGEVYYTGDHYRTFVRVR